MKNKAYLLSLLMIITFWSVAYAAQTGVFDRLKVGNTLIDTNGVESKTNLILNAPSGDIDVTAVNVDSDVTTSFNINVGGAEAIDVMESTTPTGGFGNVGLGGPASTADTQPLTIIRSINDLSAVLSSNTGTGTSVLSGYSAQVANGPGGVGLTNVLQAPTNYSLIPDWQGFGIFRNFRGSGLKMIARDVDASGNDSIDFLVGGQDDSFMISSVDGSGMSIFDGLDLSFFDADSSNFVSLKSPAVVGVDVVLTLPDTDGNAGEFLQTDGTGVLTWAAAGGGGANTNLSNLASPTAVNQDLLPGIDDNFWLGSGSFHWTGLYTPFILNALGSFLDIQSNGGIFIDPDANNSGAEPLIVEGDIQLNSVGAVNSELRLREDSANGTQYVGFEGPDAITTNVIWKLPNADGAGGSMLQSDGSSNLFFSTIALMKNSATAFNFWGANIPGIELDGTTADALSAFGAGLFLKANGSQADLIVTTQEQTSGTAPSSSLQIFTGQNSGTATGKTGDVYVYTGDQTNSGDTGFITIETGTPTSGSSGEILIRTRNATVNSGDIRLVVGDGTSQSGTIQNDGRVVDIPANTVNLTADDQVVTITRSVHAINSDNATAANRTFTISNGQVNGQRLTLLFTDPTDAAELIDTGNAALSADWVPNLNDSLSLVWFGSVWIETSRSSN